MSYLAWQPFQSTVSLPSIANANVSHTPYTLVACLLGGQTSTRCVLVQQFLTVEWIPAPSQQDTVEVKECKGDASHISKIGGDDVIRKGNEVVSEGGFLSKAKTFLKEGITTALNAVSGEGLLAFLRVAPDLASKGFSSTPGQFFMSKNSFY